MLCIKKCQIGIILIFLSIFSSIASGESLPDLAITAEDIHFSPENPTEGDSVTVTAYVVNKGSDTRDDIEVHFFESAPDKFGLPIEKGYIIIELKGGQRKKAKVKWRAKAGSNQIYVVIDRSKAIFKLFLAHSQCFPLLEHKCLNLPTDLHTMRIHFERPIDIIATILWTIVLLFLIALNVKAFAVS